MSADALRLTLPRAPSRAAVVPGGIDAWVERHLRAAREREERAVELLERAAQRLDAAREEAARNLAHQTVTLAVEIARVLVRSEIGAGRMNLEGVVREALAASGTGRAACTVHVHPLDAARLADVKFRHGTAIEADESVARGDVHVATAHGLLVREVHEALRSIHERLLGEIA